MRVQVTSAAQSRARDAAAIAAGVDSLALMMRAGTAAAEVIMRDADRLVGFGVDIHVGSGNNGGDGYIVAAQLVRLGVTVRVHVVAPPSTTDARRAEQLARRIVPESAFGAGLDGAPEYRPVHVDALLGTGAHGPLRATIRSATDAIELAARQARAHAGHAGSMVFALDVPTGVNASSGECVMGHVVADVTTMFGTCKAGALAAREACGRIHVVDIGLGAHAALADGAPQLAEPEALRPTLPAVAWNAHKGIRGRVLLIGGTHGMAGAVHFAAAGALSSGAGLVRACVHERSVAALQSASPGVVCLSWPDTTRHGMADVHLDEALGGPDTVEFGGDALVNAIREWAHVVAIGPGLGRDARAHDLLNHTLELASASDVALVLDADALSVLAAQGISAAFRHCAKARPVVITPHDGEFASLARAAGLESGERDPEGRLLATRALASALSCTVLRKGTPTLVASANGDAWCVPRGSSALATGGTGDVLTGVLSAVMASYASTLSREHSDEHSPQRLPEHVRGRLRARSLDAAALGAWVHGAAGEELPARGSTVEDVIHSLPRAWRALQDETPREPNVLCVLPAPR